MKISKNVLKCFLIGCVITFIAIVSPIAAFSQPIMKNINVVYDSIKIVVDGTQIDVKSEPFIKDGTTYLPIRAVAEALGKEVSWDKDSSAVYIGKKPTGKISKTVGISSLKPFEPRSCYFGVAWNNKIESYYTTKYPGGIVIRQNKYSTDDSIIAKNHAHDPKVTYFLDGKYSKLTGLYGLDDCNPSYKEKGTLIIYGDGEKIKTVTAKRGENPIEVNINVLGVDTLTLQFSGGISIYHDFVNVKLNQIGGV